MGPSGRASIRVMPFLDEEDAVALTSYKAEWPAEYAELAYTIRGLDLASLGMIEHVGSTAIPDLVAKDVIDVQIRVPDLDAELVIARFTAAGFRHRPEPWNNLEATRLGVYPQLVFAPPIGARHANVHTRAQNSPGAHDTLLFRDYLRAEEGPRLQWGDLKQSIVRGKSVDLATYGQAKQATWAELMTGADQWALEHEWRPRPLLAWSML
jgi:GrpB-like predicted nucleotidyltransferase (UPF0157 family)